MLYSPSTEVTQDLPVAAPVTAPAPVPEAKTEPPGSNLGKSDPAPAPQALDLKSIQDLIKADREAQEKASKDATEREGWRSRAEQAEKKLQEFEKAKANAILDPASYLRKTLGYTDKELALTSEGIMFTLLPDKADPGHRARLVEAQMMRDREMQAVKEEEAKTTQSKSAQEAEAARVKELENRYTAHLKQNVAAFKPGTYPASQAWFGQDHDKYTEMLFSTARDMHDAAQRAGGQADLTPASVAKVVEDTLSERAKRWSGLVTPQPQIQSVQKPASLAEPPVTQPDLVPDAGGKDLIYSPGKPQTAKALSDAERIRRAAAVAFK